MVFKKTKKAIFGGALALQGTRVLTHPMNAANLTDTGTGFLNIGITGKMVDVSHKMVMGKTKKRKKKKKT